jgi:hypothetical protein
MKGDKQRSISIQKYWDDKERSEWHRNLNRKVMKIVGKKSKGIKRSKEFCKNLSKIRKNEKNPMWKGDEVGYGSLHNWIRRRKKKPEFCEKCKKRRPSDLANISGKYKRDINDYEWLCRKCHMEDDGRLKKLKKRIIAQNKSWGKKK